MSHPSLKDPDPTRATLDSRDGFTNCLFSMLEPERQDNSKQQQLFRTYECMQDNVRRLQRQFYDIKTRTKARELMKEVHLAQLEQSVQQCVAVALPNSQSQNVSDSLTKLSEVLSSLEKSMKDIIRDWNEKKKMVANDPLLSAERELWVHFYTNTSKLSQIIAELGSRVQAHQAH
jgi:HAUS augmin-like complex subunit 3